MPFVNSVCIMEEGTPCIVPKVQGTKAEPKMLSALQLTGGVKRGEHIWRPWWPKKKWILRMPREMKEVLVEFKDVMPPELPKKLPQRREVDHKIELEPGAKPPARAPPELEELRKLLREWGRIHSTI